MLLRTATLYLDYCFVKQTSAAENIRKAVLFNKHFGTA